MGIVYSLSSLVCSDSLLDDRNWIIQYLVLPLPGVAETPRVLPLAFVPGRPGMLCT